MQTIEYNGHKIEVVPVDSGFYCRWLGGETHITSTPEAALFLAGKFISDAEIYGTQSASQNC